ncbi:MAG: hypothetical protein K2P78_05460 [Gemmataceae bacterium]|nr:hypothetical protein [Gemmataceae bacterium]
MTRLAAAPPGPPLHFSSVALPPRNAATHPPITSRLYPPSCTTTVGTPSCRTAAPIRPYSSVGSRNPPIGSASWASAPSDTTRNAGRNAPIRSTAAFKAGRKFRTPLPGGSGRFRFAPSPGPAPVSSANPEKYGNRNVGSPWTETVSTSGRS